MTKPKKIFYISKYARSPSYGSPTRQFHYAKALADNGYDCTLIMGRAANSETIPRIFAESVESGVRTLCINLNSFDLGFNVRRVISWAVFEVFLCVRLLCCFKNKPDVIIVSSLSLLTIINGVLFKHLFSAKLILEIRDIWPDTLENMGKIKKKSLSYIFLRSIERLGYKQADHIVGTMEYLNRHVEHVLKHDDFAFTWIPTGTDVTFPLQDSTTDVLDMKKINVTYAGTIGTANQVDFLCKSMQLLKNETDIVLNIVGDGSLKNLLQEQYGQEQNITFLGAIPREDVHAILVHSDILVNSWKDLQIYHYGVSPNKMIDYLQAGRYVIDSLNGRNSLLENSACGKKIRSGDVEGFADAIRHAASLSTEERNTIGQKGLKYLEQKLQYKDLVKTYIKIIESA